MRIGVDAMGGDYAPSAVVEGVRLASAQHKVDFVLFGDEGKLRASFPSLPPSISIVNAPEAEEDISIFSVLRRPRSPISMAAKALADGEVSAIVSAGDSRQVVAAAKYYVGLVKNIKRPVIGVFIPVGDKDILLVDAGAYARLHSVHLVHSALIGKVYWQVVKEGGEPSIGLLNIGKEKLKGPVEVRRAASILQDLPIRFLGFVEPQDLFSSADVDIVVCDGFSGNIFLKLYESLSEYLIKGFEGFLRDFNFFELSIAEKWEKRCCRYRYEWSGGVPLLGVRKTIVIAHGRSGPFAISQAISRAIYLVKNKLMAKMASFIEKDSIIKSVGSLYKNWAMSKLYRKR